MKKKTTFIAVLASAALTLGIGTSVILGTSNRNEQLQAEDTVQIGDLATFNSVFNGSAQYYNRNIELTSDIDFGGGSAVSLRMAGSFSGTLNGNGHTVSNVPLSQSFFNLISGTVENLTFTCTSSGSGFGGLAYAVEAAGHINNVTVNATLAAAVNNWGPIAFWSTGTIENCTANITIPSAYSAANTLFHIARKDSGTFTNNLYSVTGTASFLSDPAGVSEAVNVSAVSVGAVEVAAGSSVTATATLTGNKYNHIKWVSADTDKATVASATTTVNTVSVTGVAAGSTTLIAYVYADAAESTLLATSDAATVTVTDATPVTGVSLSAETLEVKAQKTGSLTAVLTGNIYTSITWSSSDENAATVVGNGLNATITGVAQGTTVITVSVVSGNASTYTDTCTVTVPTPSGFTIYFLDDNAWTTAYCFVYGDGAANTALQMSRVTANGKNVSLLKTDSNKSGALTSYNLWKYFYNTDVNGGAATSYVQFYNATAGRWGAGVQLLNGWTNDVIVYNTGDNASINNVKDSGTSANLLAGIAFATSYGTYASTGFRDSSGSICYLLGSDQSDARNALLSQYGALASDVKTFVDEIDDTVTVSGATYISTLGQTYAILSNGSASGTVGMLNNENSLILGVSIASLSAIGVLGAFLILRKKHQSRA